MGFFDKEKNNAMENAAEAAQETQEMDAEETTTEENKVITMPKRRPYAVWDVSGTEYHMKLGTDGVERLEMKYKTNLMNIMGAGQGGMPALTVMLDVAHEAMKKFHHGIKRDDVKALFDRYIENGGSQLNFYTEVYMSIFQVSGFFSTSLTDQMEGALEDAKEIL